MMETVKLTVERDGVVLGTCTVELERERMSADMHLSAAPGQDTRKIAEALEVVQLVLEGHVTSVDGDPLVEMRA